MLLSPRLKSWLRSIRAWVLALLQPLPLVALPRLPRYVRDYLHLRRAGTGLPMPLADTYPCLGDRTSGTPFDPHYFFQGAWLARRVAQRSPSSHVDIASSVLTVSVLSAFVPTTFVDYRPLAVRLEGLESLAGDLNALPFANRSILSLSCLHVIEHIGLGRYGDALDPLGHVRAAHELARVVAPEGRLYLSTPVGRERVCFNAHRVFAPATVVALFNTLRLVEFSYVSDDHQLHERASLPDAAGLDYGCGLFVFSG